MTLYFEDLRPGDTYDLGEVAVDADEMVDFARRYDPQPFHVDPVAAKESSFGELIASGWYTISLFMRLYVDGLLADSTSQGSAGGDEFRWLAPVRAGDLLTGRLVVVEARPSATRPDRGTALLRGEMLRDGQPVMAVRFYGLFGRRPAA
jgi:acyl dehydratase